VNATLYERAIMPDNEIKIAVAKYLLARTEAIKLGSLYPQRFGGNDNIIGRIGEFLALRFLESIGQQPLKVEGSSNPGYDLIEGSVKTQVKVITHENQKGRSVRLKEPWNQLVLIELGGDYTPIRIGVLTKAQHEIALEENKKWSSKPIVKITMLGSKGLIGKYGRVYESIELSV
jgi:hypothetical protein